MDPPSPSEPPPPAYELERDFDRKVSEALDRSLTISQQPEQPSSIPPGEDEWEEWDEARFEAAAAAAHAREQGGNAEVSGPPVSHRSSEKERLARQDALQANYASEYASSSTSSASVAEPSRRLPTSPPAKERPSWYSEAQLDAPAGSGSGQSSHPLPPTPQVHDIPPEEDDPDEPLPPFVAVGPSLEGPPFEQVVRLPPRVPPISNVDSPPQSPLDSVESDSPSEPQPYSPPPQSPEAYTEPVRTPPPRQSQPPSVPRLMPVPASRPPPMRFDPSVAYAKHRNVHLSVSEAESREPVDASALYNSAVSSLLSSQTKRKNTTHNQDSPTRPATTRPVSHGPQSPSQSLSSAPPVPAPAPVPPQSPGHYGAPNAYYPMQQNQGYVPNQYPPQRALPPPQPQHHQHPQPPHPQHPQPPHPQHPQPPQPPHHQPIQPLHPQYPQQVAPGFYAQPFHGVPQGGPPPPPPPPPPPTQWYPPHNTTGGGYRR